MKALSIMQPWAWLIVNGFKDIENRKWRYAPKFRGEFLIHASKKLDAQADFELRHGGHLGRDGYYHTFCHNNIPQFELGGIVGIAEIVDVVTESKSIWFHGPLGFVLKNASPLPFLPLKGALGFFDVEWPQ